MIRITNEIWIGNSADGRNIKALKVGAVLNVALDLRSYCGWPEVDYMQVGLIDGPGNPPAVYCAAVLALSTLLRRNDSVLICCHSGSRSMAVALMYLSATAVRGWDESMDLIKEKVDIGLPEVHEAHRTAFNQVNWLFIRNVLRTP